MNISETNQVLPIAPTAPSISVQIFAFDVEIGCARTWAGNSSSTYEIATTIKNKTQTGRWLISPDALIYVMPMQMSIYIHIYVYVHTNVFFNVYILDVPRCQSCPSQQWPSGCLPWFIPLKTSGILHGDYQKICQLSLHIRRWFIQYSKGLQRLLEDTQMLVVYICCCLCTSKPPRIAHMAVTVSKWGYCKISLNVCMSGDSPIFG